MKSNEKKADTKRNTAHRLLFSTTGQLSKSANWILQTAQNPEGTQKMGMKIQYRHCQKMTNTHTTSTHKNLRYRAIKS